MMLLAVVLVIVAAVVGFLVGRNNPTEKAAVIKCSMKAADIAKQANETIGADETNVRNYLQRLPDIYRPVEE